MLTPEELEKLSGAESLFPSPIPVQFVSSDEYMPQPQTRAAEGVRGAHEGHRRAHGEEARHDAGASSSRPPAAWPRRSPR